MVRHSGASSFHLLTTDEEAGWLQAAGLELRHGVQFHWHNAGYRSFDDFLGPPHPRQAQEDPPGAAQGGRGRHRFRILRGAQITAATGPSSTPATPAPTPSTAPRPTSAGPSSPTTAARPATPAC
jgi:hypothetical protein